MPISSTDQAYLFLLLGLKAPVPAAAVEKAIKRKAREVHPDLQTGASEWEKSLFARRMMELNDLRDRWREGPASDPESAGPVAAAPEDQYDLGVAYGTGDGVPRDDEEAAKWFRRAAVQGYAEAQVTLGESYRQGEFGLGEDLAKAADWYRAAALQGHAHAQFMLGVLVRKDDPIETVKWFRRAALQGHADAQHGLGVMYDQGAGVRRDHAEAARWFRSAAEQGHADARYNLGESLRKGEGVPRNHAEAARWYRAAADQGHAGARRRHAGNRRGNRPRQPPPPPGPSRRPRGGLQALAWGFGASALLFLGCGALAFLSSLQSYYETVGVPGDSTGSAAPSGDADVRLGRRAVAVAPGETAGPGESPELKAERPTGGTRESGKEHLLASGDREGLSVPEGPSGRANDLKSSPAARLRNSVAALAGRSATGFVTLSNTEGWMAEYNRLIGEARSVFPEDPHLRALGTLSHMGSDRQAAGSVTTVAEGLETYLESFESRDAFRSSAGALAKRSATGFVTLSNTEGWMAEYNRLIGEARSVFPEDPHLRALGTLSHMGSDRQAAGSVTTAAEGLETYLESFESRDAFRSSAGALAKRSATGFVTLSSTEGWMAEYNRLIGEAKSVFPEDPHLRALETLFHMGSDRQAAGSVATAVEGLETYLESFESRDAFRSSAGALAKRSATGFVTLSSTEGWMAEYNRLIGEAKSVFPEDPHLRALETLFHMGSDRQAAVAVASAAGTLARLMEDPRVWNSRNPAPADRSSAGIDRVGGTSYAAGEAFRDSLRSGGSGPEMVVVPAGSFRMGCLNQGEGCSGDENPLHEVRIGREFALGRHEVTVGEFRRFVEKTGHPAGGGCRRLVGSETGFTLEWTGSSGGAWRYPGYQVHESQPVTCVSWRDAQAYVRWLSDETGMPYRLPSESEWEYSLRAGSTTPYHFGQSKSDLCAYGNVADWAWISCTDGAFHPASAGSYRPNGWGLHDMHGNVQEWVADCWNGSYDGAPSDGGAWLSGDCSRRVLRGGSWFLKPKHNRSAKRFKGGIDYRDGGSGFRVARTLAP